MHHCHSWRMKDQLDVTCYFISLVMRSTCFGHKYIHLQELATVLMNYHIGRLVLGSLCVGALVAAGIWWCSFCRLIQPAKRTPLNTSCNQSSNTQRTENKTTDVVIHQHSRKLPKMDILMSETWWAHNKWNKIASDIKLVFCQLLQWCMVQ